MKKYPIIILFICVIFTIPLYSAEIVRIAVLDLKADGVPEKIARTVSKMLRTDLINMNKFIVLEKDQVDEILKDPGAELEECTEQTCAVKIGKILSVRKILVGEVGYLGRDFVITVRIVDIEKGVSEYAARDTMRSLDNIDKTITRLTNELSERIDIKSEEEFSMRSFIPGLNQLHTGKTLKGYIFLGSFILSGIYAGYSLKNFYDKKSDYDDNDTHDNWKKVDKAAINYNIAIGIFAAVYAANWVDILFFSNTEDTQISNNAGKIKLKDMYVSFTMFHPCELNNEKYYNITFNKKF